MSSTKFICEFSRIFLFGLILTSGVLSEIPSMARRSAPSSPASRLLSMIVKRFAESLIFLKYSTSEIGIFLVTTSSSLFFWIQTWKWSRSVSAKRLKSVLRTSFHCFRYGAVSSVTMLARFCEVEIRLCERSLSFCQFADEVSIGVISSGCGNGEVLSVLRSRVVSIIPKRI